MTTFKTKGLVLREYEAGEADKRLILLCKGHGRLAVYARGARKPKSKFLAASQILTYGDYIIADGGQFLSMNQGTVIESFYPIHQDYDKLLHASYVLEVCESTVPDRAPGSDELLLLALKTLQHISANKIPINQTIAVFLFRFFLFSGIAPMMDSCCVCGEDLNRPNILFCREGMVCPDCQVSTTRPLMRLSPAAREAVRHILNSSLNGSFLFTVSNTVLNELLSFTHASPVVLSDSIYDMFPG